MSSLPIIGGFVSLSEIPAFAAFLAVGDKLKLECIIFYEREGLKGVVSEMKRLLEFPAKGLFAY